MGLLYSLCAAALGQAVPAGGCVQALLFAMFWGFGCACSDPFSALHSSSAFCRWVGPDIQLGGTYIWQVRFQSTHNDQTPHCLAPILLVCLFQFSISAGPLPISLPQISLTDERDSSSVDFSALLAGRWQMLTLTLTQENPNVSNSITHWFLH